MSPSAMARRSMVVNPLTAGCPSSTSGWIASCTRAASSDGKLRDSWDAAVPMVYESPSARYRSGLSVDVRERAPDVDLCAHAADHLVGELGRRRVPAQVSGAHAVRHRLERRLINGA